MWKQDQGLGRSKGGFSNACCDALGNPLRFFVTAGQRSDYVKFRSNRRQEYGDTYC